MSATYKDIQRITGLSLSTISKYFNGGSMREENRKLIDAAVKALDYRVNPIASGLRSSQTKTIGILIPELTSTFHTTVMSHAIETLRDLGYGSIVCDAAADRKKEESALLFLLNKLVDGIITIPVDETGTHLRLADKQEVPVVLLDRLPTAYTTDSVLLDNKSAGGQAAHLLMEKGHTKIGMIAGPQNVYTMGQRAEGFRQALEGRGMDINAGWIQNCPFSVEGGYRSAKGMLGASSRPSALFCGNYELTLGAYMAINELGVRIPQDISLVGFDNLLLSHVLKPRITMIVQPMEQMAQKAAQLLVERIQKGPSPDTRSHIFKADLVEGKSVREL